MKKTSDSTEKSIYRRHVRHPLRKGAAERENGILHLAFSYFSVRKGVGRGKEKYQKFAMDFSRQMHYNIDMILYSDGDEIGIEFDS